VIVDCRFHKWQDKPHWRFGAELIDSDPIGTWLGCRPPVPYTGPPGSGEWQHAFVIFVPADDWWIASFNDERNAEVEVYVDICTPATWHSPTHVSSIDLDLDVIRYWDGRVFVDDEDEFAEHQVAYGYPADVIEKARATCDRLLELVTRGVEPFDGTGRKRLDAFLD
jgi:hypothetical protein